MYTHTHMYMRQIRKIKQKSEESAQRKIVLTSRYSFTKRRLARNCITNNALMTNSRMWRKINPRRATSSYKKRKEDEKKNRREKK